MGPGEVNTLGCPYQAEGNVACPTLIRFVRAGSEAGIIQRQAGLVTGRNSLLVRPGPGYGKSTILDHTWL